MPATSRVALLDATLVRGWYLDVRIASVWTPVSGIMGFKPKVDPTFKDGTTFDGGGWGTDTKTLLKWGCEFSLLRAPQSSTPASYDVGAEYLRTQSLVLGPAGSVNIRYYEVNGDSGTQTSGGVRYPITEAWEGFGSVVWDEKNDGPDDLRVTDVKIMGRGARTAASFNPASA